MILLPNTCSIQRPFEGQHIADVAQDEDDFNTLDINAL